MSAITVQGVCRLHVEWVVVPFRAREYSVFGYCVNSCGGCRHAMVRAWCSSLAVGLHSSLMRFCGAQWVFLLQVISPRFCGMFSNYFPSVSREKTLLSRCTTRSMAKGVTERIRKYVYFNFRRRREFSFYFAKYMWFGLAFVPGHVPCGRRTCFVSACHVSHELFSALPHQHDVRCCVALCSKSSLFMVCGAVTDQGVGTLVKLRSCPRVVGTCG